MKLSRRIAATATATVLSSTGLAVTSTGTAQACPTVSFYGLTSSATRIPFTGIPHFKSGPGGRVAASRSTSKTVSYQVTAGAESEVGAVLAKAKVSVSASLVKSQSTSVIYSYSHNISSGKYGHLRYVSWGKKIKWKKYRYNSSCQQIFLGSGTIKFPTNAEGWYYWQTNS